ncbi:UbiA family prenyltransferase [Gracilimonas sp.]|uniref:UbiA family prenyltransferase n=1 Tax=Gracilimonas sp. TaxID=1974203 RepID=UPI003BAAA15C
MKQILNFFIHLRLHYQFFILSGGYLIAALFVDQVRWNQFGLQFLNVHVLLFGGATAYNSWWDKDEGPIGGLKSPPKMKSWMWPASMIMQYGGLAWAITIGWNYAIIYVVSMFFFWLYSTPLARWKGKPVLSIVAIGISTGTNSFFMGYLAAGGYPITYSEDLITIGVAAIILSLYPVSQIYQTEEDKSRGDRTFAVRYGIQGVKWFFSLMFLLGASMLSVMLYLKNGQLGLVFGGLALSAYAILSVFVWKLKGDQHEYEIVMRMKFFASFSFVAFIVGTLFLKTLL